MSNSLLSGMPLPRLPNFRLRRIAVRWMLLGNAMGVLLTAFRLTDPYYMAWEWEALITWVEPAFFLCWLGFVFATPRASVSNVWFILAYLIWPAFCGFFWTWAMPQLGLAAPLPPIPAACAVLLTAALMLGYWDWRFKALTPSLSERKLQALEARIRPHFLFNTLSALASLTRLDPSKAEEGLLNLADLMRDQMRADDSQLRSLSQELVLCERYIAIEQMRFSDRVTARWEIEEEAKPMLVPALSVQPLMENAIIHGLEALNPSEKGEIVVSARVSGGFLIVDVKNRMPPNGAKSKRRGNQYALGNIQERLDLLFHGEGRLQAGPQGTEFWVARLRVPAMKKEAGRTRRDPPRVKAALEA